ncbi:MAG: type VI secretion system tube protein Hcp [Planctomycetes bacterium]|nr:type VI secretion system tube protein Hcp [Planctomycetota bacterium]
MSDEIKKQWTLKINGLDRFVKPGDSVRDKCELSSVSHGIFADQPMAGQPRRTQIYDLSVARETDAATPIFMRLCQTGEALPQVIVELVAEKDGKEIYRLTYELLNARISRVNTGGSVHGQDFRPYDDMAFTFEKMRMRVTEGEQNGSAELKPTSP